MAQHSTPDLQKDWISDLIPSLRKYFTVDLLFDLLVNRSQDCL